MAYISTEQVSTVRKSLKAAFPTFKFSVTRRHHSTVCVVILAAPFDLMQGEDANRGYANVNEHYIKEHNKNNAPKAEILQKISDIAHVGYYNNSDLMTDYFDYAFYVDISIGDWERPFVFTGKEEVKPAQEVTACTVVNGAAIPVVNVKTAQTAQFIYKGFTVPRISQSYTQHTAKIICMKTITDIFGGAICITTKWNAPTDGRANHTAWTDLEIMEVIDIYISKQTDPAKNEPPTITPELKESVKTVLTARAYTETIRPKIEDIKQSILNGTVYMISEHWTNHPSGRNTPMERIISAKNAYLMNDEDAANYYGACHQGYINAGFDVKEGYCPLLIAEDMERQALRYMVAASEYIAIGAGMDKDTFEHMYYKLDWIKKYEENIISLVLGLCDKKEFTADTILKAA